uniref:Uncharacterized protein n=1 Tax=Hyaloperonospora arabidopsidis (strain Emoy2) TaxID=559515 RepID=M4B7R4_HYAAE
MDHDDQTPPSPSFTAKRKRRRLSNSHDDESPCDTSLCLPDDSEAAAMKIHSTVLESKNRTLAEMNTFVQRCHLWQQKLNFWHSELATKAEYIETCEVTKVVRDLVTSVETAALQRKVMTKDVELQWARWMLNDVERCISELLEDTRGTEEIQAMEKQLKDDRVVELEMQLAQKRAVEQEKAMELSLLRADEEQMMHARRLMPREQFEMLVAEKETMEADMKRWQEKVELQVVGMVRGDEKRRNLKEQNQKLVEEVRQLREQQQTKESKVEKQIMEKENENKRLQAKLTAAETKETAMAAMLVAAEKMMDKSKQRKEELEILYTKFSSAMDSVSDKTMRLEEMEQALKDLQNVKHRNKQLEKQVAQLQQEKSDLSAALRRCKNDMKEKMTVVQKQLDEVKELEYQQKERASKLDTKVTELKEQNEALTKQQLNCSYDGAGQLLKENDKPCRDMVDDLVIQVAEKEALQMFVQRYYNAAEEKCNGLLKRVRQLELEKVQQSQEQTELIRSDSSRCAHIETNDDTSVRNAGTTPEDST